MKKNLLIISIIVTIIGFSACNGNNEKTEVKATPDSTESKTVIAKKINLDIDCSGVGNLLIGKEEAETMKENYAGIYVTSAPGKYFLKSDWIDASVIIALANLFKDHPELDGVRFINGAKKANDNCMLILVPTIPRKVHDSAKSDHVNDWTTIDLPPGVTPEFQGFNLGDKVTNPRKDLFNNLYTMGYDKIKCLSSSIWFSKCVINSLREFIEDGSNNIDGIRVWFGAYSDLRYKPRNPSQVAEKQSTIILVPTHPDGGHHIDDWDIIKAKSNYDSKNLFDGYNHGELCPQICN